MVEIRSFVVEIYNFLDIGESCTRIKIVNTSMVEGIYGNVVNVFEMVTLGRSHIKFQIVCRFTFNPIILTHNTNVLVRAMPYHYYRSNLLLWSEQLSCFQFREYASNFLVTGIVERVFLSTERRTKNK